MLMQNQLPGIDAPSAAEGPAEEAPAAQSASLAEYLGIVSDLVKRHTSAAWVRAEISKLQQRNHLFVELVDHDANGSETAKCAARVWSGRKESLLAKFKAGTGAPLEAGMKVLLRVEASFHPQYGFALTVSDIDPSYTLGDMERKLLEIRQRLADEGLYGRNRALTAPVDFTRVVVVSPENAAGLGDFRIQADRLAAAGVCQFDYYAATFQGLTAADSILAVLRQIYAGEKEAGGKGYDALVIIRGGGAVTDLAWLNDYSLGRAVCCMNLPVLTGIGHQQDNTILDEVANLRFDTPSKVIAHIARAIVDRAREAQQDWQCVREETRRALDQAREKLFLANEWLSARMREQAGQTRALVESCMSAVNQCARETARLAGAGVDARMREIELRSRGLIGEARALAERAMRENDQQARQAVLRRRADLGQAIRDIDAQARHHAGDARVCADACIATVADQAKNSLGIARREMEYRMAEIIGLGPERTLSRGYALVRAVDGHVVTRVEEAQAVSRLSLQLADGTLEVAPIAPQQGEQSNE